MTEESTKLDNVEREFRAMLAKMTGGLAQVSKMRKVNYLQGMASFTDATLWSTATGPKSSSWYARIAGMTADSTVAG